MQAINPIQGDAILNLMEQCWVVQVAYDQKQTHDHNARWRKALYGEPNELGKDLADKLFQATNVLAHFYHLAVELKVQDSVLVGVLTRYLPRSLTIDLHAPQSD